MKRVFCYSLCICSICSFLTACNDTTVPADDAAVVKQAIKFRNFGSVGGSPWSDEGNVLSLTSANPDVNFGQAIAVGNFRSYANDLMFGQTTLAGKGHVYSIWNNKTGHLTDTTSIELTRDVDQDDSFGYDIVAGNFCVGKFATQRKGDIAIISMPTAGNAMQGGISIWGLRGSWRKIKELYGHQALGLDGIAIAVGDVNGDGMDDLVYSSMPLTEDYDYLPMTVSVVSDICSKFGTLNPDATVSATTPDSSFSKIYLKDLDGNGTVEIIVLDSLYREDDSAGASEGAIHFYTFDGNSLTESRPMLVGDVGASINDVAFSDIDGDGDLDLIVGEPMYKTTKKREGRVRTYTNPGIGKAFNTNDMKWSAVSNRSHARFGTSVTVADLNKDGVDDLVVGAVGLRGTTDRSQAYAYVYMGSHDGKVFSLQPYWRYVSDVSSAHNDDFGQKIIAEQLDGTGWLDLMISAPNAYNSETGNDEGRVDIFYASENVCYSVDKCLIGDTCYAAGKKEPGNRCHVCDPTQNNFEWTDVTCEDSGNICAPNVCLPESGCTLQKLDDGTACGATSCSANVLSQEICQDGTCTEVTNDCGNYRCTTGSSPACMLSCTTNADCYIGVCVSNHCTSIDDGRPVLVLADYSTSVAVNSTFELDASDSYDPDGGDIDITWWSTDANIDLVDTNSTLKVTVTAPNSPSQFSVHALITDDEGLSRQEDLVFEAKAARSASSMVKSPVRNAIIPSSTEIPVTGETDPNTPVSVILTAEDGSQMNASCSTVSDADGAWQCILTDGQTTIPAGDYVITATSTINGVPVSYDVNIHLSEELKTDENGMLQGGSCSMTPTAPVGGTWYMLFAGLFLGLIPLRRRMRQ